LPEDDPIGNTYSPQRRKARRRDIVLSFEEIEEPPSAPGFRIKEAFGIWDP